MKLAAVIVNYNSAELSIQTAKALAQCATIDCIIIVDNCSTDSSWEQLSQMEGKTIFAVRTARNGGYGYGNNYGIQYARKEHSATHALIVNPDVNVTDDTISTLCKYFEEDNLAVASAEQIIPGHGRAVSAWKIYSLPAMVWKGGVFGSLYFDKKMEKSLTYIQGLAETDCVAGSMLMVDISKFLQVGGYDEQVFLYFEEDILGWKMKQHGYRTVSINSVSYLHAHGRTIRKQYDIRKQRALLWKSKRYYLSHYRKSPQWIVFLASVVHFVGTAELQMLTYLREKR